MLTSSSSFNIISSTFLKFNSAGGFGGQWCMVLRLQHQSSHSIIVLTAVATFTYNKAADCSGIMYIMVSILILPIIPLLTNKLATDPLQFVKKEASNNAMRGGGIHATS